MTASKEGGMDGDGSAIAGSASEYPPPNDLSQKTSCINQARCSQFLQYYGRNQILDTT
jgi:hypothetical protein